MERSHKITELSDYQFLNSLSSEEITREYSKVRAFTEKLLKPLSPEDACGQSMPDCSPAKWHAAHTTWFFETFILKSLLKNYKPFDEKYEYMFNSYYNSIGKQYPRAERGLITRPSLHEILEYRDFVDRKICDLIENADNSFLNIVVLGLNHEQQHQELLLMDIKNLFSLNPCQPAYRTSRPIKNKKMHCEWNEFPGGEHEFGCSNKQFCFDNETPLFKQIVSPFKVASQLVKNGDYLKFIEAGGYKNPEFWLADGWDFIKKNKINSPLYWKRKQSSWYEFTLFGDIELLPHLPVCHISFFEADAYATWKNCRLPTEFEIEVAAKSAEPLQHEVQMHPEGGYSRFFDDFYSNVWQWTNSAYLPFPGFKPEIGAIGEYNGKFMSNQMVLKGSSCITPPHHSRPSYRNFFYPHQRWPFTGIRLAHDI